MSKNGKTILVTGGAGFVGSHCVVKLLLAGYEVVVVDNLSNCWKDENRNQPEVLLRCEMLAGKRLDYHNVDLINSEQLNEVFLQYKVDCVIHFAALKSVSESCSMPLTYYHNNIMGTISLLQTMEKCNVKQLIYSSSSTVYGTPQYLPLDEKHQTGVGCSSPYGKSKYFVEEILKDLCISKPNEWKMISLRYFNPVGAHESGRIGEDPRGIPNNLMPFVSQVAVGKRNKVMVYGKDYDTPDGTGVRDYIHIQDLADGHVAALKKIFEPSYVGFKPYNLGTGKGHSVLEVIEAYKLASGRNIRYDIVGRRDGDIASSYCDASLAKKELGWVATRDLKDMCRDSWKWQVMNPNGYQSEHANL